MIRCRSLGLAFALAAAPVFGQSQSANENPPPASGEQLYDYHCAPCHAAGPRHPGTSALELKYNGGVPALLTEREDLTPLVVRLIVRRGINAMPYYRKTEISDSELDAIAEYLAAPRD